MLALRKSMDCFQSKHLRQPEANRTVRKSLNFVRRNNIRISIKNTGHDYFGRSSAANSLGIWIHHMKGMKYHKKFEPQYCKAQYENVGEINAAIAGGFGQGGGHGPLSPKYGLTVDQATEFDVASTDSQRWIVNECTDPDLFWAMQGDGGGNYAILTSYKFRLRTLLPSFIADTEGHHRVQGPPRHHQIISIQPGTLSSSGIAGYNFMLPDHMLYHDFLAAYVGIKIAENTFHTFPNFSEWHNLIEQPAITKNSPAGRGLSESGRFVPRSLFQTPLNIDKLSNAILTAMQICT
ncbi:flavin adenine dinucleotide binding [Ascochyta rabiei]|uniref:Flavin adenine dinucleotide binding n=1 Tax=Didymella rabiei TaxID=5454 RepID=A0A163JTY6_DIDRA|nr:flavin adenine dinucleotide binding [Ascochyta rabiei]